MNKVLLTGRLTRDPEMRSLSSGKAVTQFSIATNEYIGQGKEKAEFHNIVTWDRLAQTCGEFLGKGQQVAVEGRLQTRSWDDDRGARHWKTEVVANHVEMLSGRRKKDYADASAANALAAQAAGYTRRRRRGGRRGRRAGGRRRGARDRGRGRGGGRDRRRLSRSPAHLPSVSPAAVSPSPPPANALPPRLGPGGVSGTRRTRPRG